MTEVSMCKQRPSSDRKQAHGGGYDLSFPSIYKRDGGANIEQRRRCDTCTQQEPTKRSNQYRVVPTALVFENHPDQRGQQHCGKRVLLAGDAVEKYGVQAKKAEPTDEHAQCERFGSQPGCK